MRNKSHNGWLDIVKTIVFALVVAMIPRAVLCQNFTIPSGSMEPTLQVGDYIIVAKYAYGWSRHSLPFNPPLPQGRVLGQAPRRGDIVVFKEPRDGKTDIIKRLVGLPGDRLQVRHGVLYLNDAAVPRQVIASTEENVFGESVPVTRYKESLPGGRRYVVNSYGRDTPAGNTGVYLVPAGCYFMMGDNRDNSLDSRFGPGQVASGQSRCPWSPELDKYLPAMDGQGFVPFDDLVGRADLVLFSWKPGASLLAPWTGLRWNRSLHWLGGNVS
ncbi:MAG: signal peptidase I [Caulobacteraceae bacterium]